MSNIDTLLDGATNNKITLTVNEPTRSMSYNGQILLGVEGDHKAERIYFKAPRFIFMDKDIDLCSENIKVFIKFQNATNNTYIYECLDKSSSDVPGPVEVSDDGEGNVTIDISGGANSTDDGDGGISLANEEEETVEEEFVYFSWILTRTVAEAAGIVSFVVCIQHIGTDENGAEVVLNEWHSTPFTGEIQKGIPVDSATPEIITDPQTSIYQLKLEIQSVDLIVKQHDDTIKTLSEAVNNKADKTELDAKANQTDLEALTKTVNTKADQTDLDALEGTINAKADQSDLNSLESRVTNLENNGGSGSGSGDNTELENRVTEVETEIDNIKGDINTLETVVNSKASQNDVDTLETDVTVLKGRVDTLEAGGSTGEGEDNPVLLERLAVAETDIGNLKTDLDALKTRVTNLENSGSSGSSSTEQNNILEFGYDFPASQDSTTNYIIDLSELPEEQLKNANTIMIRASEADIYLNKVAAVSGSMYVYTACEYIRTSSSAYPKVYSCVFDITDEIEVILSIYNMNFASQISTLETKVEDIETSDLESRVVNLEAEHTISFTLHDINGDNQDVTLSAPFRTQWSSLATSNPQIMIDQDGCMCYGSTSRPLFKDSNMSEFVYETDYVEKNKVYYYGE